MNIIKRFYGWRPQLPDIRDTSYRAIRPTEYSYGAGLPDYISLLSTCPPVYDQGQLGSCSANAVLGAYEMDLMSQQLISISTPLSRLFLYYNTRLDEGTVNIDAGASIRDAIKSIGKIGVCKEEFWPYDVYKFNHSPTDIAYQEAGEHQALVYGALRPTLQDIKLALSDGYPVIFGFTVYESFESSEIANTGIMTLPKDGERVVGGHAVLAVGYSDADQYLTVRNSWGTEWGQDGYFKMPYSYIENLTSDFWVIREVE